MATAPFRLAPRRRDAGSATGGAGALLARSIKKAEVVAYEDLGDGRTLQVLQATTDAGETQLHLTYFAADGTELAVPEVEVHAIGPDGTAAEVTTTKYTQGHYLASATLPAGEWTFEVHGTTADGQDVTTSFAATVG